MSSTAIIGAQWGDEGKGKITDYLSSKTDYVVRFQGGHNAGHTLWNNGVKTVLHVIPSGVMQKDCISIIDHGVVFEPENFLKEIDNLRSCGVNVDPSRIMVSDQCTVITSFHMALDAIREMNQGNQIGTTLKGIGPAYEDKIARKAIKVIDLRSKETLHKKLTLIVTEKKFLFEQQREYLIPSIEQEVQRLYDLGKKVLLYVQNTFNEFALNPSKNILFEGAQGVLLDIDYGSYPYVTSSSTSIGGIFTGSSSLGDKVDEVIGITKAYCTRVGEGPFPTELSGSNGKTLMVKGNEYGATTGRNRRCGWLDLPLLRYASKLSRFTCLALTKVDILNFLDELKVCYAYELESNVIDCAYPGVDLKNAKPLYRKFAPIKTFLKDGVETPELLSFIHFIEREINLPVKYVAYGPDREELLIRETL